MPSTTLSVNILNSTVMSDFPVSTGQPLTDRLGHKLPGQLLWLCRRHLAGVAFADVGGRPAVARGAVGEQRHEARDHLVGQVAGVDGVYQGPRVGRGGITDDHDLARAGEVEVEGGQEATETAGQLLYATAQLLEDGLGAGAVVLPVEEEREPEQHVGGDGAA